MAVLNKYEESAAALRTLINFHKMKFCPHFEERHCAAGSIKCHEKGKCPRATFENDVYLEALEMSLQLVKENDTQISNNYQECKNIINGLISYHERMLLAFPSSHCKDGCDLHKRLNGCPTAMCVNGFYLEALKTALQLIEEKIRQKG